MQFLKKQHTLSNKNLDILKMKKLLNYSIKPIIIQAPYFQQIFQTKQLNLVFKCIILYSKTREHYPKIINEIIKQLNSSNNTANNILKTLIITDYLLKYGCSGIIDDLKERIGLIRHYSEYKSECQEPLFQSIRQKAQNITIQLTNRNLLYKEKEIAKQMKLKIQMNKLKLQAQCSNVNDETQSKLDDMLENYIYKYMDKFHDKLESWGDQMNEKLDSLINNVATNSAYKKDENGYYYPESCMDDVMVVKDRGLDFKQNSQKSQMTNQNVVNQENVQPNKQVIKQKINLLD